MEKDHQFIRMPQASPARPSSRSSKKNGRMYWHNSGFIGSIFGKLTTLQFLQEGGYFLAYLIIYWFEDSLLMGHEAVSLCKYYLTFDRNVSPSALFVDGR